MTATVTVLGAGSALPRAGYGPSGYALRPGPDEAVTLLDCGPGTIRSLATAGIELEEVRRVVFSHYHLDHCLDLFALFFARRSPRFDPPPRLELRGPVGLAHLVREAPHALGRWAKDPAVDVHEVEVGPEGRGGFSAEGLEWTCVANGHSPEAVSWRVEQPGGFALVYSGDAIANPVISELARGAELFVCECSFPDESAAKNHLTPSSAAKLAQDAGVRRLVLTHFYPEMDPTHAVEGAKHVFTGEILAAHDGARFEIG